MGGVSAVDMVTDTRIMFLKLFGCFRHQPDSVRLQPSAGHTQRRFRQQFRQRLRRPYFRFRANGGPGSQSVETNTGSGIIVINRIRPYRLGYYFSGWSLTRDGKTQYRPGDSIAIQGDLTLYAVWASPTDSPRTGDESHIGLWAAIAGLSLVAIGAGAFVLYRKNRLAK